MKVFPPRKIEHLFAEEKKFLALRIDFHSAQFFYVQFNMLEMCGEIFKLENIVIKQLFN